MGIVNKIVNVVVLVLAIACVVLGTILFKKREHLRFRGDKMADMINKVSKTMDKESFLFGIFTMLTINDRDWFAPIMLTRKNPVAKIVIDLFVTEFFFFKPGDNFFRG